MLLHCKKTENLCNVYIVQAVKYCSSEITKTSYYQCLLFSHIQLSSTKSADHKTTLLHFLANTVETRHPAILDFVTDLRNVEEAAKCRPNTTISKS